jgi:hypothetical protein
LYFTEEIGVLFENVEFVLAIFCLCCVEVLALFVD